MQQTTDDKKRKSTQILDNTEHYQSVPGILKEEVTQLLELDVELQRLFEVQMRKKNKNDEMIRTKIKDLNDKPALRDYLFKKVSDEQLAKDIMVIQKEMETQYQII